MKFISKLLAVFLMAGLISVCLTQGVGAESTDEEMAALMTKAEQGDAIAQHDLGFMYFEGKGIRQDLEKAVYWFTKAAEQDNDSAQHNLGFMYSEGKGVQQNFEKAVYWYTKAAEQGAWFAQYNLGVIHSKVQDYVTAYAWFNLAASQDKDIAKGARETLLKKMSPDQIEEGQKLSRELYDNIHKQAD